MASQGRAPGFVVRKDHASIGRNPQGTLSSTPRPSPADKVSSVPGPAAAGSSSRNDRYQGPMSLHSPEDARGKFRPDRPADTQQTQRSGDGFVAPLYAARKSAPSNIPTSTELFVTAKSLSCSASSMRLLQGFVARYNPLDVTFDDKGFTIVFPKTKQGSENCFKCYLENDDSMLAGRHQLKIKLVYNTYKNVLTDAPMKDPNAVEQAAASSGTAHTARQSTAPHTPVISTARSLTTTPNQDGHQTARAPNTASPNKGTKNTTLAEQTKPQSPTRRDSFHTLGQTSPSRSIARTDRDETASTLSGRTGSEYSAGKRPKCHRCGKSGSEFVPLVNCSTCKRRYHRRCHEEVPAVSGSDHGWQCDRCAKRSGQKQQLVVEQVPAAKASAPKRPHPQSTNVSSHTAASVERPKETRSDEPALKRRKVDDLAAKEATIAATPAVSANDHEPLEAGLKLTASADLTTNALSSQDSQLDEAQRLVENSFTAMENRPNSVSQGRKLKFERRKISQQSGLVPQSTHSPQGNSHTMVEKPACPASESTDRVENLPVQQTSTHSSQTAESLAMGQVARELAIGSTAKTPASTQKTVLTSTKPKLKAKRTRVSPKLVPCTSCRRIVEVFPDMPSSRCKDCRKRPEQTRPKPEANGPSTHDEVRPVTSKALDEKPQNQVDELEADPSKMKPLRSDEGASVLSEPVLEKPDKILARPATQDSRSDVAQVEGPTPNGQASSMPASSQVQVSASAGSDHLDQSSVLLSAQKTKSNASDSAVRRVENPTLEEPSQKEPPLKMPVLGEETLKGLESHAGHLGPEQCGAGNSTKTTCKSCRKNHKRCKHTKVQVQDANAAERLLRNNVESGTDEVTTAELTPQVEVSSASDAQDIANFGNWKERPKGTYQKLIEMAFSDYNGARLQYRGVTKWIANTFPGYTEGKGQWVPGIGATMTMHTVPKGKCLWTKQTFEGSDDGVGKGDWFIPVPEAFANFHHFDRDSRLAILGPHNAADQRSHGSSPPLQKGKGKPAEVASTETCTPVANNILPPRTKTCQGKRKDLKAADDDVGVNTTTRKPSVPDVADAEGHAGVGKQVTSEDWARLHRQIKQAVSNRVDLAIATKALRTAMEGNIDLAFSTLLDAEEDERALRSRLEKIKPGSTQESSSGERDHHSDDEQAIGGEQKSALQESHNYEDKMGMDRTSPASAIIIGSSREASRETSPETDLQTCRALPRLPGQSSTEPDTAPHDISSDDSNDQPYLRYSNRRSERSAAQQQQQPATLISTAAEPTVSPIEVFEGSTESENVEIVKDLYEVFPALRPNFPVLDREAKMVEIKARPSRKQIFGKPAHLSRLQPGAVLQPLRWPHGQPAAGLQDTSAKG